jgi:hypothetical protein
VYEAVRDVRVVAILAFAPASALASKCPSKGASVSGRLDGYLNSFHHPYVFKPSYITATRVSCSSARSLAVKVITSFSRRRACYSPEKYDNDGFVTVPRKVKICKVDGYRCRIPNGKNIWATGHWFCDHGAQKVRWYTDLYLDQ